MTAAGRACRVGGRACASRRPRCDSTNGLNWVFLVAFGAALGGAVVVWIVEEAIVEFGDALWWAIVTATTVGYGDVDHIRQRLGAWADLDDEDRRRLAAMLAASRTAARNEER